MAISETQATEFAAKIYKEIRPGQEIGLKKLADQFTWRGVGDTNIYAGLRILREKGVAKLVMRHGHKDGSLVKFYAEPLPPDQRDRVKKHSKGVGRNTYTNGIFRVQPTFHVTGGEYTAKDLRHLARAVLKALGEL